MKRKTREEKTMEHSQLIVGDLAALYSFESEAYKEYVKLFEEYKKITKRFSKTVAMNDNVGRDVIIDNENLKENVSYTVKKAREKIIHNIEEHRKTKEVLAKYSDADKQQLNTLKNEIVDLKKYIAKLESQLHLNDEIHHQFEILETPQIKPKDINNADIRNTSYQSILTQHINSAQQNNLNLTVSKLTIDNFKEKIKVLNVENSDSNTIIKVLHKFFTIGLGSKNIVYYFTDNIFYFLFPNHTYKESQEFIERVNVKRKLSNVTFTFSIGTTQYIKGDDLTSLQERLYNAHLQASEDINANSSSVL